MNAGTKVRRRRRRSRISRPYESWLYERLAADPDEAQRYLQAAMEDEDPRIFLLALKDVVEAQGGIGKLAKAAHLNRVSLYRMLSEHGNPELSSLSRVLNVLGLRLKVESRAAREPKRSKVVRSSTTARIRV